MAVNLAVVELSLFSSIMIFHVLATSVSDDDFWSKSENF